MLNQHRIFSVDYFSDLFSFRVGKYFQNHVDLCQFNQSSSASAVSNAVAFLRVLNIVLALGTEEDFSNQ